MISQIVAPHFQPQNFHYLTEHLLTLANVCNSTACNLQAVTCVSAWFAIVTYFQIRMGAISQTNVNFVGSHCGVSIGEDGPSQMGLEDIALFRSIPGM